MPDKILKEPNDESYKKRIQELKEANKKKTENIKELIEKKKQESYGVKSDDKSNVFAQHKELSEKRKQLRQAIDNIEKGPTV